MIIQSIWYTFVWMSTMKWMWRKMTINKIAFSVLSSIMPACMNIFERWFRQWQRNNYMVWYIRRYNLTTGFPLVDEKDEISTTTIDCCLSESSHLPVIYPGNISHRTQTYLLHTWAMYPTPLDTSASCFLMIASFKGDVQGNMWVRNMWAAYAANFKGMKTKRNHC